MDFYCKMFIQSKMSRNELADTISHIFGATADGHFSMENDYWCLDIRENKEVNKSYAKESFSGFLYFPYFLDIELLDETKGEEYKVWVSNLFSYLCEKECQVVTACSFEEELINGGNNFIVND